NWKTKREAIADEMKNSRLRSADRGDLTFANAVEMTFEDLFELWRERVTTVGQSKKGPLGPKTQHNRRSVWDARIAPHWRHVRLDMVTHDKAAEWLQLESQTGNYSPTTLYQVGHMFLQILDEGVRRGIFDSNPAKDRLDRALYVPANNPRKDHTYLTPSQLSLLAKAALSPRDKAIILIAGLSGLRWGEITALHWSDIDFVRNEINVTKAYSRGLDSSLES